jgi:hypothetical protein
MARNRTHPPTHPSNLSELVGGLPDDDEPSRFVDPDLAEPPRVNPSESLLVRRPTGAEMQRSLVGPDDVRPEGHVPESVESPPDDVPRPEPTGPLVPAQAPHPAEIALLDVAAHLGLHIGQGGDVGAAIKAWCDEHAFSPVRADPLEGLERWFAPLKDPPKPDLVLPYAVLLVMALMCRKSENGTVSTTDLFSVVPREAVSEALHRLRWTGHIEVLSTGAHYRVTKTPVPLARR